MKIEHIAIWTYELEKLKDFYCTYFQAQVDAHYRNERKNFESYFLSFQGGARLELMTMPNIPISQNDVISQFTGIIHLAFATDSQEEVDQLTDRLAKDGYKVVGQPRVTGDGYYESVIFDPDQNRIEIAYTL